MQIVFIQFVVNEQYIFIFQLVWENVVEMLNFVFGPQKGTSLHETTSFDVLIVKIGAGLLAVDRRKNQKTSGVT